MNQLGDNGYLTYDFTSGLPIPTFHCKCGQNTVGFSICLKCNPQRYEVEPAVEIYDKRAWNAAIDHCIDLLKEERRVSSHNKEMLIYKMKEAKK